MFHIDKFFLLQNTVGVLKETKMNGFLIKPRIYTDFIYVLLVTRLGNLKAVV